MRAAAGVLCFVTLALTACAPQTPTSPSYATAGDLQFCLSETNRYRAMASRAAVQQWTPLDEYATAAAQHDGVNHVAHGYSQATRPSPGLLRFENEIPWWPLTTYHTVRAVIRDGIAAMWAEGSSGAHYQALTSASVTLFGCGAYVGDGEVTVVQAFR